MEKKAIKNRYGIKGTNKIIIEIICLLLVLNFFYEGIYKIAYFENYGFWLRHVPFLRPVAGVLNYLIPIGEIVLSLMFLVPRYMITALSISIVVTLLFVLYIMCGCLFTDKLFFPFHALWEKPRWMQIMLVWLGWAWLSLLVIVLLKGGFPFTRFSSNSLRNTPAGTGNGR